MILYVENPIRKLLELISEFNLAGYKINTQKSPAFLYTNNETPEREIKKSIPFTIATKRIKYLGINLPKETEELYTEHIEKQRHYFANKGLSSQGYGFFQWSCMDVRVGL